MNQSHNPKEKTSRMAAGVRAAALISVLGLIVMIADHSLVVPAEVPLMGSSSGATPYEATSLSADGRGVAAMQPSLSTEGPVAERKTAASVSGLYPEPASDAVRDEGGHPPSF